MGSVRGGAARGSRADSALRGLLCGPQALHRLELVGGDGGEATGGGAAGAEAETEEGGAAGAEDEEQSMVAAE